MKFVVEVELGDTDSPCLSLCLALEHAGAVARQGAQQNGSALYSGHDGLVHKVEWRRTD